MKDRWLPDREEAARAVYLDFEGEGRKGDGRAPEPVLLGFTCERRRRIRYGGAIRQLVLERSLRLCVGQGLGQPENLTQSYALLDDAVREAIRVAHALGGPIVTWSTHDLKVVREWCSDTKLTAEFEGLHRNATPLARRWARECRGMRFERDEANRRNPLQSYLELARYEVPDGMGPYTAANAIRAVQRGAADSHSYAALSPAAKRAWETLVGHNYHDCRGLRELVMRAVKELGGAT